MKILPILLLLLAGCATVTSNIDPDRLNAIETEFKQALEVVGKKYTSMSISQKARVRVALIDAKKAIKDARAATSEEDYSSRIEKVRESIRIITAVSD